MTSKLHNTIKYFIGFQMALVIVFTAIDFMGLLVGHKINFVAIPKGLLSLSATVFVWFRLQDTIAQKEIKFFYFFTWPLYAVFLILMPLSGKRSV
jgi:hypothetical protein